MTRTIFITIFISILTTPFAWAAESRSPQVQVTQSHGLQSSVPIYSGADHPQGEIWYLRELGATTEADQLEKYIENVLKSEPIKFPILNKDQGSSVSYYVQFSNNIFAIMKEADPFVRKSPEYEVAAFRLDRALNLNMVPVTVLRELNGKRVSLQLIVPAAINQNYDQIHTDWQFQQENNVLIFDSLLLNFDRIIEVMHNLMLSTEGRLIAIDNSRLMKNKNQTVWREPYELTPDFLQGLIQFDEIRIPQLMGDLLDWDDLNKLMMHLKLTRDMMKRSLTKQPRPIISARPASVQLAPRYDYEVPIQLRSVFTSNGNSKGSCGRVFQLN